MADYFNIISNSNKEMEKYIYLFFWKKSNLNVNILTFKTLKKIKKNNFNKKMSNKELEKIFEFFFEKKKVL